MRRLALIGSGYRIQNNFLPALGLLRDRFQVCAVHSPTAAHVDRVAESFGIPPVYRLADLDFANLDVIAISIRLDQVAVVLRQLIGRGYCGDLVLDTPVFDRFDRFRHTGLLRHFRQVAVTEDYMHFPQFELMRRACRSGLIGQIEAVNLHGGGYEYHGLALLRSFLDFAHARSGQTLAIGAGQRLYRYHFVGGVIGTMIEPYSRSGELTIVGSKGVLTTGLAWPTERLYRLDRIYSESPESNQSELVGFTILGPDGPTEHRLDLPQLAQVRGAALTDQSEFNGLKTIGLAHIFASLLPDCEGPELALQRRYGYLEALYDRWLTLPTYASSPRDQRWLAKGRDLGLPIAAQFLQCLNQLSR
jgi:hypothetical protein